jgi:hypothetical protein
MEDYATGKIETFDELVTKHTRRDLEELALKYGLESLGGTKSQLAEFIIEAMKKQKEAPKPATHMSPKETSAVEKTKNDVIAKVTPMVEKPKSQAKPTGFGSKGVLAKANAINNKATDLKKAGKDIRDEGIRNMTKSVKEFHAASNILSRNMHSEAQKMIEDGQRRFDQAQMQFRRSIDAQIKENSDAVARMHSGTSEIISSQEKMAREFQKAGKNIRDEGCRNLQNGLAKFQSNLNSQVKENREAVSRMYSGARELQGRAASYQEQDLKNYVRDFYYG